jgi:F420H(2)-dependent biliverdin reductase
MDATLTHESLHKLETQTVIWFASVRPDGRPHLAPVWYVWFEEKIFISTDPNSVKISNITQNANVTLSLEDGTHPVICEGTARILPAPVSDEILSAFLKKYEWDPSKDEQYNLVVEILPRRWKNW